MKTIEIYQRVVVKVPNEIAEQIKRGVTKPFCLEFPLATCQLLKSVHKVGEKPKYALIVEAKAVEHETMEITIPDE